MGGILAERKDPGLNTTPPSSRPHVLYVIPRTDLDSLNPGKMAAQACHAQRHADTVLGAAAGSDMVRDGGTEENRTAYAEWCAETAQGFGTTIVLAGGSGDALHALVKEARGLGLAAGVVHDPTYPIRDGQFTHAIPLDTVVWVFAPSPGLPLCHRAVRAERAELVEVQQHRRMRLGGFQQIAEAPHHVWANCLELERPGERHDINLVRRDREVIGPEVHQPLGERRGGGQRGDDPRVDGVVIVAAQYAAGVAPHEQCGLVG